MLSIRRFCSILWAGLLLLSAGCRGSSQAPVSTAAVRTTVVPAVIVRPSEVIPVYVEDLGVGSFAAPVTLVAFLDIECPFCAKAWETLERVRVKFGPDRLRLVVKHLPLEFHPNAAYAARSVAAMQRDHGDAAAMALLKLLLSRQTELSNAAIDAMSAQIAAGANREGQSEHGYAVSVEEQLERDAMLANRLGIDGTPAFRINGLARDGALPESEFEDLIEQELREVQQAQAQGLNPGDVYAQRVRLNSPSVSTHSTRDAPVADTRRWDIPLGDSPQQGPATALVTLVAFMDYECPYCQRANETLKLLLGLYPETLRIVWKHRPLEFHARAEGASLFAIEVQKQQGSAAFFRATDQLFGLQSTLANDLYEKMGKQLNLDSATWQRHVAQHDLANSLAMDTDLADEFAVDSTPQFFVNGQRIKGARPVEDFVSVVDQELARAELLRRSGVAESQLAEALMKDALPAPSLPSIDKAAKLPNGPALGPAIAPVTIHIFSDYQCPFCQRADVTLRRLLEKYPKDIRLVWHDMPLGFHDRARAAATLAREVRTRKGDVGFFKISQILFENQANLSEAHLAELAAQVGVSTATLAPETRETAHGSAIDQDLKLAADLHITSTPTLIIGRTLLEGAQPLSRLERLFRRERIRPTSSNQRPGKP